MTRTKETIRKVAASKGAKKVNEKKVGFEEWLFNLWYWLFKKVIKGGKSLWQKVIRKIVMKVVL